MNTLTRREMISTTVLTAGALVPGCGGDPLRNERMQAAVKLFGC